MRQAFRALPVASIRSGHASTSTVADRSAGSGAADLACCHPGQNGCGLLNRHGADHSTTFIARYVGFLVRLRRGGQGTGYLRDENRQLIKLAPERRPAVREARALTDHVSLRSNRNPSRFNALRDFRRLPARQLTRKVTLDRCTDRLTIAEPPVISRRGCM
jgi:hypothetical protein